VIIGTTVRRAGVEEATRAGLHDVLVDHAQRPEMDMRRIAVIGK